MRKQFSTSFKAQVVQDLLKEEKSIAQLAAEYGVHPTQLGKWKATALKGLPSLFEERSEVSALKAVQRHMHAMGIAGIAPGPKLSRRDSEHRVYPCLLRDLTSTYPNHVWGID